MKFTKNVYIRNNNELLTEEEIADTLFFFRDLDEGSKPEEWVEIKEFSISPEGKLEINIPDSLINDIISSNAGREIVSLIKNHEAAIAKLRSKQR